MVLIAALITHRTQGLMRVLGHIEMHWNHKGEQVVCSLLSSTWPLTCFCLPMAADGEAKVT